MNAIELLTNDHQTVSTIFDELESGDAATRRQTFPRLKMELDVHAHIEETIFYPALKEKPETRELVPEAYAEHNEVKQMLTQLEQQLDAAGDAAWSSQLSQLRDNVEHHVEEEESEMFARALAALGEEQMTRLGARMQEEKQQQMRTQMPKAMGARGNS
jgi:hemerythrin-like domain-containing protein